MAKRLAAMGGSYGNIAALKACIDDERHAKADVAAFLGDAIGCSGHSEEVVAMVRENFSVLVAGNHEQEAARNSESCGCGYASKEDEEISCEAFRLATSELAESSKKWLGSWPARNFVELEGGRVLLCHGSPGKTSEFLYEMELDDLRLEAWLDQFDVRGFVCTHSGLPWIRHLRGGRFAVNCGAVGKPDHDGDTAIHYAMIDLPKDGDAKIEIRRVEYDVAGFTKQLENKQIASIFIEPLRTGVWTSGIASLPASERHRPLRRAHAKLTSAWKPEKLEAARFASILSAFREMKLVKAEESEEISKMLSPDFPFFASMRLADTMHVHVKVDDTDAISREKIQAIGGVVENERDGYVKFAFAGGINMIFSSIDIADEDTLGALGVAHEPRAKPFVDHVGIDLRRETGVVRASFDDVPAISSRIGWSHVQQGGRGRPVFCCHVQVAQKHWVYPPAAVDGVAEPFNLPVEFAYGPLVISGEASGCDLRPIDPRHPAAPNFVACHDQPQKQA